MSGDELAMVGDDDRPIVYLDVDDVLIAWGVQRDFWPAEGAAEFLRWLISAGIEVRWLTSWAPSGRLSPQRCQELAKILDMDPAELQAIENPLGFPPATRYPKKHHAIDFETDRPWVIVHDEHWHRENITVLEQAGLSDRFLETNTSRRPDDLRWAREEIEKRFGGGWIS